MMKRFFALAGVSALTGIISGSLAIGCDDEEKGGAAPTEAGADVKPPGDAGRPDVDGPPDEEDAGKCMTTEAIDATKFPYKSAATSVGACTTTEAAALSKFFKDKVDANEDVKISEWSATVGDTCGACVFGDGSGAAWPPILTKDDALDTVNRGGCIEIQSGKESCGAAYQRVVDCAFDACARTCESLEEYEACRDDLNAIAKGPCKAAFATLVTECGQNDVGKYETACSEGDWTFDSPIKAQCIVGGKADAGADGG